MAPIGFKQISKARERVSKLVFVTLLRNTLDFLSIFSIRRLNMGFFNFFGKDINKGYKEYLEREKALLIDVRNEEEYKNGHIPGSRNIPLLKISKLSTIADRDTPIYTYCLSGTRSAHAQVELCKMGFSEVHNIGGISSYKGSVER